MKYSMLYRDGARTGVIGEKTVYDLSLDLTLEKMIRRKARLAYFLGVVSKPLTDADAIRYRQDIVRDFENYPALIGVLRALFDGLADARETYADLRRQRLGSMGSGALNTSVMLAMRQCTLSANTLLSSLRFINALADLSAQYSPGSEFLRRLLSDASGMIGNGAFSELVLLCGELAELSEASPVDVRVTLDRLGEISSADLIGHGSIFVTDPDIKQKRGWLRKRGDDTLYPCERARLSPKETEKLFPAPFFELANVLDSISKQIFERYGELFDELRFYEAAADYIGFLAERGISCDYPEFSENGVSFCGLYDLQLTLKHDDAADITPHSLCSDAEVERIIIYGGNGCGKTTLLRSVATMQLLAQAGLPVPAKSPRLRVYSAIFSQFAEAEKEFEPGSEAGRFEEEVRMIAKIVEETPPGSLVILNETFQSTSYEEGASCLGSILRYFSDVGISYMAATHMTQLRPVMRGCAGFFEVNEHHEIKKER